MKHNNKQTAEFFVLGKAAKGSNFETDGKSAVSYDTTIADKQKGVILIALCYRACNWCGSFFRTDRNHGKTEKLYQKGRKYYWRRLVRSAKRFCNHAQGTRNQLAILAGHL